MSIFARKPIGLFILLAISAQIGQAANLACSEAFLSPPLIRYLEPKKILNREGPFLRQYAIDRHKTVAVFEAQYSIANILRTQPELVGLDLLYVMANYPIIEGLMPHESMKIGQAIARESLEDHKFSDSQKIAQRASVILTEYKNSKVSLNQIDAYEAQSDLSIIFLTEPTSLSRDMINLLAKTEPISSPSRNSVIQLAHDLARWKVITENSPQQPHD